MAKFVSQAGALVRAHALQEIRSDHPYPPSTGCRWIQCQIKSCIPSSLESTLLLHPSFTGMTGFLAATGIYSPRLQYIKGSFLSLFRAWAHIPSGLFRATGPGSSDAHISRQRRFTAPDLSNSSGVLDDHLGAHPPVARARPISVEASLRFTSGRANVPVLGRQQTP